MSFWGGLARGTGNFAKSTGKAALDLNKAGGSFARWALRLPGHKENAYSKAISNGITSGLQGNPFTAGIGRHFQGHDLFAHDQGDGYGIFDPGKGRKESGNGSGSGRGFGNGSGGYGNIYHFHTNNYGHTYNNNNYGTVNNNSGTVNNNSGTVNNSVSTNTINGNNYGIQGGSGNTQNFGMSPLVNHLNNAYVDTHIQDYQPPKIKTPPISNVLSGVKQKALPFTNNSATSTLPGPPGPPGGQVALKAAAPGSYDDDGNFVPAPREKMPRKLLPSQLNSPAIYNAPGIKSVIPEKPSFKGPQNNQFMFNPSGESAMNPTQASLLTRKASSMLPYINDVYAFEPEDVRMALALDAAIQFYKNAADADVMDAPAIKTPSTKTREEKTVDPSVMLSKVHPDILAKHTEKALASNPGFTGFDDAVHGRYSTSDGTEFGKGKRFTVPISTSMRLGKGAENALFHGWAEDHFHPTNSKIGGGATAADLVSEQAKAKKLKRVDKARDAGGNTLGDTLSEGIKRTRKKELDNSDMEPLPGQSGSEIPLGKHERMKQIRKEINSPNEFKINPNATEDSTDEEVSVPRTEEEIQSLVKSLHDSTPHLTLDQKKKQIPQAYHGYLDDAAAEDNHTNFPARHVSPAEKAKGQELARRQQEWEERRQQGLEPKDYKGVDLPEIPSDQVEGNDDDYVDNRTRRDMEKGKFSPGNREDAPIESYNPDDEDDDEEYDDNNPDILNDGDYRDALDEARKKWLGNFGNKPIYRDEDFKENLRERNERIPESKRRGKVDLDAPKKSKKPKGPRPVGWNKKDKDGNARYSDEEKEIYDKPQQGIAPIRTKRKEEVKKDHAKGIASEIARNDSGRRLRQENERDNSPLARSQSKNTGESGKSRKNHQASKLNELRTITAGMDSYEIEAIADGLLNLGYEIDHIVQVASEGEDVNGSTSAVADVANVKDSHEIPDWVKRGLH